MKRLRLLGIGAKLATAGGRSAWIRLALIAIGFMIGSALLLLAASIVPGVHASDVRKQSLYGAEGDAHSRDGLRVWYMRQSFGDADIQTSVVEPIGNAPIPPGLPRVPGPGEIFASERVAAMWPAIGTEIGRRLHGHLVGTIGHDGVAGPDDLAMWVGKPAHVRLRSYAYVQTSFGGVGGVGQALPLGALLAVVVAASAILLPIWLFVATVTRLSAATREARLAAIRLAGGTESQVRMLAGTEAGVAAAMGTGLGVPLYLAARARLADGAIGGLHLFPSDLTPPLGLTAAIIIGLPALAIAMSIVTMRHLLVSPLGVSRHVRTSHAGWRWVLVLVAGLGVLAWGASQHAALKRFGDVWVALIVGGSLVCLGLGLVGTATWSSWVVARRLAGSVRSVAAMLGFRRLEAEPTSVSRVVGGVALMIALVGVVQSGLLSVERSEGPPVLSSEAGVLHGNEIGVFDGSPGTSSVDLSDIPGVSSVRWTRKFPFGSSQRPIGIVDWDGSAATLEAIRDRLAWSGADIRTLPQLRTQAKAANDDYSSFRRGGFAITVFLLLVSAATLLVAMVDWLMERRRALAVLSAVGVAASTVRRSILAQVGLPLAASLLFGVAGAFTVTALLYRALNQPIVFAGGEIAALVGVVVLVVLGVTAASAPWLRITRRPELLRDG
jgi:FtsX-like permease family protein